MAYSLDMRGFSLHRFEEILTTVELLPSRRPLAEHISAVVPLLERMGVDDLEALRKLLAKKTRYGELADQLEVDEEYLTLLNREVNSYKTKPVPLARLGSLCDAELATLAGEGIRSTKDLYERCAARQDRVALARQFDIDDARLETTLQMANLVRINGVGPAFARFLIDLGLRGPEDVLATDTEELVRRYEESIRLQPGQPKLRTEDIEYCKRFSLGLQTDVEW